MSRALALALLLAGCGPGRPALTGLEVALEPSAPEPDDALVAVIVTEAKGLVEDGGSYRFSWSRDGSGVEGVDGATVEAAQTAFDELWEVRVVPVSSCGDEGPAAEASVRVVASTDDVDGDGSSAPEDCDDANPLVHPGAVEECNGRDDDCDGLTDDLPDADGDQYGACLDCDDADAAVHPGAEELCDGRDTDCDQQLPQDERDEDADGWMPCDGDCDDTLPLWHPEDRDGDGQSPCDGDCDDSRADTNSLDLDGDGVSTCDWPPDCDDGDAAVQGCGDDDDSGD